MNQLDEKMQKELDDWIAERPPIIQEAIKKFPPTQLYILNDLHQVLITGYSEPDEVDGETEVTFIVEKTGVSKGLTHFTNSVYGVKQADLKIWEE